jgi:hypothetical protein
VCVLIGGNTSCGLSQKMGDAAPPHPSAPVVAMTGSIRTSPHPSSPGSSSHHQHNNHNSHHHHVRSFYREALHQMFAGSMAGGCSAIATAPLDLAKTRMQVEYAPKGSATLPKYNGLFTTLGRTLADEGAKGWFKGLGSCLLGLVPSWTIYFTCYNTFKR